MNHHNTTSPLGTMLALNKTLEEYSNELQQIYVARSAGYYTFHGVLASFIRSVEKIVGNFENPEWIDMTINTASQDMEKIYSGRTAGESTWIGVLTEFLLNATSRIDNKPPSYKPSTTTNENIK